MKHEIKKLPKSQVKIEIEMSAEEFDKYFKHTLEHAKEHVSVPGFRKGNVPTVMVEEKVGAESLLADAADYAVNEAYAQIVKDNNLEPILAPQVQVEKLAKGNPFIFSLVVSVLPEVELPDYQKIASQIKLEPVSVTDQDVTDSIEYIRKTRAKFIVQDREVQEKDFVEIEYESPELGSMSVLPQNKDKKKIQDAFVMGEGGFMPGFEDNVKGMRAGEEKEFSIIFPENSQRKDLSGKEVHFKVKVIVVKKMEMPEINDELAKSLGKFKDLEALRLDIKNGLTLEKEDNAIQKRRNEMLEKISAGLKAEIPQGLIEAERDNIFRNFKAKISKQYGITFEQYLASIKQEEKVLQETFTKEAEKKIKGYLVLKEIGKKENIEVTEKEIEEEANHRLSHYPKDAVAKIDINELKEYTKGVLFNEKVFLKLESFAN